MRQRFLYMWSDREYLMSKWREAAVRWIAWKLPRELVTSAFFRVVHHGTTGQYGNTIVPEVTAVELANRWESAR